MKTLKEAAQDVLDVIDNYFFGERSERAKEIQAALDVLADAIEDYEKAENQKKINHVHN